MDDEILPEDDTPGEDNPKTSVKGRKRVSRRKRVKRPRERGRYKPKSIGIGDVELPECIFSDAEEREEYLDEIPETHSLNELEDVSSPSDVPSSSGMLSPELENVLSSPALKPVDESEGTQNSRPASAASLRPISASSSRPTSAASMRRSSSLQLSICGESTQGHSDIDSSCSSAPATPFLIESAVSPSPVCEDAFSPSIHLIELALCKFKSTLKSPWIPVAGRSGFHLLHLSDKPPKSVQREIFLPLDGGSVSLFVHCKPLPFAEDILCSVSIPSVVFNEDALELFCSRGLEISKALMKYAICQGANHEESRAVWGFMPDSYVDRNPYQEGSYVETCRSLSCNFLVELGKGKRCSHCTKLIRSLRNRSKFLLSTSPAPSTPNIFLTPQQCMEKLHQQHDEIRKKDKKIAYLEKRINDIMDREGVDVDSEMNDDLSSILANADLSPTQKIFLEEQMKYSGKADARAHRWHPYMIRLALYLKMVSSSGYEALRDSGAIKLPSSRTLYDYSHAIAPQEGVSDGLLKLVSEKVSKLEKGHQKFVALLCDEMHVSKNLVYRQSDGHLVGYSHLDEVDKEIMLFEKYINGDEPALGHQLANKVLAFMVKGLTSDVKCVVASYACNQLTKEMLYARTWNVISHLERAGVKVLAVVSDGSAVNRAFYNMHTPITQTESGVVFDTLNLCSPDERPLFFVADVAHLIKTIRNCFYNSGDGEKKTRCLEINGEQILWKTIIRLYLTYKQSNLRISYKLNSQNVFPNSYSCMKVRFAAEVLSATVAFDIEKQKWPRTQETVKFIRKCNQFFDCLNGAHSSQHIKTRNQNLAPYKDLNDPRFNWLQEDFLAYLEEWKLQVEGKNIPPTEKAKKMLSRQTLDGIEIAVKGFTGATRFLLKQGADFVMARVFSQDPLEQHFSRQRAAGGGSRNPNISQFQYHQVSLGLQRELGIRRRKGNVKEEEEAAELSSQPLPKRSKKRQTKP